ncbi:MAG: heme-binding protein [Chloroflexi bacterium]|nr:heme-binding protein [Chloroflexota bacterium]
MERLDQARAALIIRRALDDAAVRGLPIAVAIVDHAGLLVAFARSDGVAPVCIDAAIGKAYTAAMMRMATRDLAALALPGAALHAFAATHQPRPLMPIGGGVPIIGPAGCIGAVGVSGGSVDVDHALAADASRDDG